MCYSIHWIIISAPHDGFKQYVKMDTFELINLIIVNQDSLVHSHTIMESVH